MYKYLFYKKIHFFNNLINYFIFLKTKNKQTFLKKLNKVEVVFYIA